MNRDFIMKYISSKGYKKDSPDKDRPFNYIPSSNITMKGVEHPVLGIDDTGYIQFMIPGQDYSFFGDNVLEIPIRQQGGGDDNEYNDFLKNWYNKRKIEDDYIQEAFELDKLEYLKRLQNIPRTQIVDNIDENKNITGRYDRDKGVLIIPNSDKYTSLHEKNHYVNDFDSYMRSIHNDIVSNEIKLKRKLKGIYKDNPEQFITPDEVHSRIMVLRKAAGFEPDKYVTKEDLNNYLKGYKGDIENVNDLLNIVKDKNALINLLNFMADTKTKNNISTAQQGGENKVERDIISKVIMNRNKDKDFVRRAYDMGQYPNMFTIPGIEFGDRSSHLMEWGEDDTGQAYMYPSIMNEKNEAIKVPNQYADYISSEGYKKATGMIPKLEDGGHNPGHPPDTLFVSNPNDPRLLAYRDSLYIYNTGVENLKRLKNGTHAPQVPPDPNPIFMNTGKFKPSSKSGVYFKDIKPLGTFITRGASNKDDRKWGMVDYFKKPTQPIELKMEDFPNTTNGKYKRQISKVPPQQNTPIKPNEPIFQLPPVTVYKPEEKKPLIVEGERTIPDTQYANVKLVYDKDNKIVARMNSKGERIPYMQDASNLTKDFVFPKFQNGGNILYVDNPNDTRLQAYRDSLKLYNSYQELKEKLNRANYVNLGAATSFLKLSDQEVIMEANRNKEDDDSFTDLFGKLSNKYPKIKASKEGNLYKTLDFYPGLINEDLGFQYFSDKIKPISEEQYRRHRFMGDARLVKNYSNVNPKQKVILKKTLPQRNIPINVPPKKHVSIKIKTQTTPQEVKPTKMPTLTGIISIEQDNRLALKETPQQDMILYNAWENMAKENRPVGRVWEDNAWKEIGLEEYIMREKQSDKRMQAVKMMDLLNEDKGKQRVQYSDGKPKLQDGGYIPITQRTWKIMQEGGDVPKNIPNYIWQQVPEKDKQAYKDNPQAAEQWYKQMLLSKSGYTPVDKTKDKTADYWSKGEQYKRNIKELSNIGLETAKMPLQAGAVAGAIQLAGLPVVAETTAGLLGKAALSTVGAMGADYLYNQAGGKFLGDALGVENPVGNFLLNMVSPGSIAGIGSQPYSTVRKLKPKNSGVVDISKIDYKPLEFTNIKFDIKELPETDKRLYKFIMDEIRIQTSPENIQRANVLDNTYGTQYSKQLDLLEQINILKKGEYPHNIKITNFDNLNETNVLGRSSLTDKGHTENIITNYALNKNKNLNVKDFQIELPKNYKELDDETLKRIIAHELRHNIELNGEGITPKLQKELKNIMKEYDGIYNDLLSENPNMTIDDLTKVAENYNYRVEHPTEISAYLTNTLRRDMFDKGIIKSLSEPITIEHLNAIKQMPENSFKTSVLKSLNLVKDDNKLVDMMNKMLLGVIPGVGIGMANKNKWKIIE